MLFDKIFLKNFNHFIYNQEMSSLLVPSHLFWLLNYCSLLNNMKSINLVIFGKYFSKLTLYIYNFR